MILRRLAFAFLLLALPVWSAPPMQATQTAPGEDAYQPVIHLDIQGDALRIDVRLQIAASLDMVWATLTDIESMPRYVSNLHESRVLDRSESRLRVFQKGAASFGPITFPFEMEREITLSAKERIDVVQVRGNLKRYRGTTLLRAEGNETWLDYHAEAATDTFIPPILGHRFIENETREQYVELAAEIVRRQSAHRLQATPVAEPVTEAAPSSTTGQKP